MKGVFNVMRELTEKDFARAVKNPYFDKLMTKVEVAITNISAAVRIGASKFSLTSSAHATHHRTF